ncbi:hypothetical protein [Zavarzinia sp. CC-PAN008]|uniref:hypothetical protein n=1 Tax=Zavarzinia sp. CC-PAN008 TaxID=3243332 RepID=UPI003F74A144
MRAPLQVQEAEKAQAEAGFTLVEVMVAGALALALCLPAAILLQRTLDMLGRVETRFRQAEQARQVLALLGDGSAVLANIGASTNPRGYRQVEGLHSRRAVPANWTSLPAGRNLRSAGRFVMADGTVAGRTLTLSGDAVAPLAIACTGAGVPAPDCAGTEVLTLTGFVGRDPVLQRQPAQFGITSRTIAVDLTITDPYRAASEATGAGASERFRTMFNLNVDIDP